MLECLIERLPPELVEWRSASVVRAEFETTLNDHLARCTDLEAAKAQAEAIGLGEPRDHLQRIVPVDDARVLAGIRFFGGDPTKPFVDLEAWTDPPLDLVRATDAAIEAFAVFNPTCSRVLCAGAAPPCARARADQAIAAAPLRVVAANADDRVTLIDADVEEAATFVASAYTAFKQRNPGLADLVFPSGTEELDACRSSGRLCWWLAEGERVGLIAVERSTWMGMDGWLMIEEVADPSSSVRSTAALAQKRLASELMPELPGGTLFGTIDAANAASRRAAERAGRREIASWWFIER